MRAQKSPFSPRIGFCVSTFALVFLLVGGGAAWIHRGPSAEDILAGADLFAHEFQPDDPRCGDGDGLGPVFNERSCVACHFLGGVGGAGPNPMNVTAYEALPVPGRPGVWGGGIHHFATEPQFAESLVQLQRRFPAIPGAIRTVDGCAVRPTDFDPLHVDEMNTPSLFGIGLLEDISETAIAVHGARRAMQKVSREFGGDFAGTGVGRLRITALGQTGRFGWKGQFATVEAFVANACAMELGLTNPMVKQPLPHSGQPDEDALLDMTRTELHQLVSFVRSLPRPQQVLPSEPRLANAAARGEDLFAAVGCADCHVPEIGGVEGVYTDFHLYNVEHDHVADTYIEPDFEPEFTLPFHHPRPSEWKTPPLWGVADSAPYFHDGQSPTLIAAIRRHGRDARFARDNFLKLPTQDQFALVAFLKSLRAPLPRESKQ